MTGVDSGCPHPCACTAATARALHRCGVPRAHKIQSTGMSPRGRGPSTLVPVRCHADVRPRPRRLLGSCQLELEGRRARARAAGGSVRPAGPCIQSSRCAALHHAPWAWPHHSHSSCMALWLKPRHCKLMQLELRLLIEILVR